MKTFRKPISVFKSAASGLGYTEVVFLECHAKTLAGVSMARKHKRTSRTGWQDISVVAGDVGMQALQGDWREYVPA